MLRLYHNGMSSCSQKARLAFAEKGVAFDSVEINLFAGEQRGPDFLHVNPRGLVPALDHEGEIIVESSVIMAYVDEAFAGPELMPTAPHERARARDWMKRVDTHLHAAVGALLGATVQRAFQKMQPEQEVLETLDRVADPIERAMRRSLFLRGVEAPEVRISAEVIATFLADMEKRLGTQEWLASDRASLADWAVLPYVLRIRQLGLGGRWSDGLAPGVGRWFEQCMSRASVEIAINDWIAPKALALIRAAGDQIAPAFQEFDIVI